MSIKDRVTGFRRVKARDVKPHPQNWRVHPKAQRDALKGLMSEMGFAGAILARELTDGSLEAIDGHLRLDEMGDMEVPVIVTDLTEDEARKLLALYDPLGAMAQADDATLAALLESVQTDDPALTSLLDSLGAGDQDGGDDGDNSGGLGEPVIQYVLIFEDEAQQTEWHDFLKHIRTAYPDHSTMAGRVLQFIRDNLNAQG